MDALDVRTKEQDPDVVRRDKHGCPLRRIAGQHRRILNTKYLFSLVPSGCQ